MLGYKLGKIHRSVQGFDFEADAVLLLSLDKPYMVGTVFFNKVVDDSAIISALIPVRAEYEDPETGVIKAVTL